MNIRIRFPIDNVVLSDLPARAFGRRGDTVPPWASKLQRHSVTWVGAFAEHDVLVGSCTRAGTAECTPSCSTQSSTLLANVGVLVKCSFEHSSLRWPAEREPDADVPAIVAAGGVDTDVDRLVGVCEGSHPAALRAAMARLRPRPAFGHGALSAARPRPPMTHPLWPAHISSMFKQPLSRIVGVLRAAVE